MEQKMAEMMEEERAKMTYDQSVAFIRQYIATGKTQSQVAQELGISPGALSAFLSGTYKAPHTIIIRIEDLADINTQKNVAPTAPAFKDTSISRMVSQAIKYSHLQGKDISRIWGCRSRQNGGIQELSGEQFTGYRGDDLPYLCIYNRSK